MNCVIFGAGGWGTAMAIHLARQGQTVTLVPRRAEQALDLATTRENKDYLPGHLRFLFTLFKERREGHRVQLTAGDHA